MIYKNTQAIEINGDPGGNRTRDNLIKSHDLFLFIQRLALLISVKPPMAGQYVTRKLSNLFWVGLATPLLFSCAHECLRPNPDYSCHPAMIWERV